MAYIGKIDGDHDKWIEAICDLGKPGLYWDQQEPGLRVYIGARKITWQFFAHVRDHGANGHAFKTLGRFDRGLKLAATVRDAKAIPAIVFSNPDRFATPGPHRGPDHMGIKAAREAAKVERANLLQGTAAPNKRSGVKFAEAFADYVAYLQRKADSDGKPARWAKNVQILGNGIMLPKWSNWSLADMSERPDALAEWHREIVKRNGPTSANHCARIIRAMFKKRAGRDRTLNVAFLPTSAVELAPEVGKQAGMSGANFPAWFAKWKAIENATHRGYHLANLLTGARPGELARVRWSDFDREAHLLTIGDAKAGNTIEIPTTPEIESAIKLAATDDVITYRSHGREFVREKAVRREPHDLIFPGCKNNPMRDDLPARGHALRRTYKTIATDHCGIPDDISACLLGHVPEGMSQKYLLRWARTSGPAILGAQAKISQTIMALLKAKPVAARKRAA